MPRTQHFKRTKLWWTSWRPYKTPIHVLHNVMEDAKNNKKALWVAFQDMSKTFDSIGMVPLRHALTRICLPPLAIDFIINLFQHRKMKVITKYGLSDELQAMNGIDQGEVISHSSGVFFTTLSYVELWMMNYWVILCLLHGR